MDPKHQNDSLYVFRWSANCKINFNFTCLILYHSPRVFTALKATCVFRAGRGTRTDSRMIRGFRHHGTIKRWLELKEPIDIVAMSCHLFDLTKMETLNKLSLMSETWSSLFCYLIRFPFRGPGANQSLT